MSLTEIYYEHYADDRPAEYTGLKTTARIDVWVNHYRQIQIRITDGKGTHRGQGGTMGGPTNKLAPSQTR